MEYCEGGSLDAIYKYVSSRKGRIGESVLGKISEAVSRNLTGSNMNDQLVNSSR